MKLLSFFTLLFLPFCVRAQVSLSVAPGRLFFDVNSPRKTDKIHVLNTGKQAATWQVFLQDWDRDSTGQKHFYDAGAVRRSCASEISFFPSTLTVPPGGTGEITVSIKDGAHLSPKDTARSAMLIISQAEDPGALKNSQKQASIMIRAEFAVQVYILNGASQKAIAIEDFYLQQDSAEKFRVVVRNAGLQPLDTKAHIEITDKTTGREWKINEVSAAILPGDKRISTFALPVGLPKGNYLALAVVEGGEDLPVKVGELTFEH
ncbi:hypothetical protein ACTHGU_14675 [Chitinophagaceae bacterium MMS25-I14]